MNFHYSLVFQCFGRTQALPSKGTRISEGLVSGGDTLLKTQSSHVQGGSGPLKFPMVQQINQYQKFRIILFQEEIYTPVN